MLGYTIFLYLTLRNYDSAIIDINKKISAFNNISKEERSSGEDYADVFSEVSKKLAARSAPLKVINELAQILPPGTFVNRMVLNENHLEISVASKEPLAVFKKMGNAPGITKISIKGPPVKNRATSFYEFNMSIELSS